MTDPVRTFLAAEIAALQRVASIPAAPKGYGVDLVCIEDLDPHLAETRDDTVESLAQDLFHRITTPRGAIVDDPDFGEDVLSYASQAMGPREIASVAGRLASECRKDDRVASVVVDVVQPSVRELNVSIAVTPEDPKLVAFKLIVAVSDGTALLEAILQGG